MAKKKLNFNFGNLTALLILGLVIIVAGILFARFDTSTSEPPPSTSLKLFFIASSGYGTFVEDTEEEGVYTLTLQNTSPALTYIARNPDKYFGTVPLAGFVNTIWGEDSNYNVTNDFPNGILTAFDPATGEESVIELELSEPQMQGSTIEFRATQPDDENSRDVKSFFDTNLTDFPPEFTNSTLVIDLSTSDTAGNMLEILNASTQ